ncbi:LLM class flavin-dependent oxidoreductase [Streptomyces sp. NPDC096311]|uniref:LLM class flavin-dependent oxidoreductase n=1 Tax=Streptomyces sp. NPDC096311 TaxID=3366083 RepID=UPI0037FD29CE
MKFSIYMNPQTSGPDEDVERIEAGIRQAVRVTDAGFAGVVLTEHHLSDYNTYGDNIMMAAHLAARAQPGTRFFLAAVIPSLHHPIRLAQQINLLDILTQGNAIVGLGSGGSPVEFFGLGRNPQDRFEDHAAVADAMNAALAKAPDDPPLKWATRYESGTVFTRVMPGRYSGSAPLFARAAASDEGARAAGEAGMFLFTGRARLGEMAARLALYRDGLVEAGLDDQAIEERLEWSFCQKQVIVRDSDDEAREEAFKRIRLTEEYAGRIQGKVAHLRPDNRMRTIVTAANTEAAEFFEKAFIVGTPATVRAELQRYAEAGIRHLALYFNFGFMTSGEADRSIDLFLDEVYPHFRQDAVASAGAVS